MLRDEDIVRVLESTDGAPREAAEALVSAANQAGGEDNVTVVLFELVEPEAEAAPTLVPAQDEPGDGPDPDDPDGPTVEDVRHHGAGKGSRWPALLLLLAIVAVVGLALWWSLLR
jgi:hypothetical protein